MLGRRKFLGALTAGLVNSKRIAKDATKQLGLDALQLPAGVATGGDVPYRPMRGKDRAQKVLKWLLKKTATQKEFEIRTMFIHRLSANSAVLRSVNLQTKIRMTQREAYFGSQRLEEEESNLTIAGKIIPHWSDDDIF